MDLFEIGGKLYFNGQYIEALEVFQQLLSEGTEDENDVLNYIGSCYGRLENYEKAIEIFDKAIAQTKWERPIFNKGNVMLKLKRYEEALELFEKAIKMNPENEDAYYYLGNYYLELENYEEAIKSYTASLLINNDQPETHLNLGIAYYRIGKLNNAIEEYDLAKCENIETQGYILSNMALVLNDQKKFKEALDVLFEAKKLIPDDAFILNQIATCYLKLRKLKKSLEYINEVLDIDATNKRALHLKKALLEQMQNENIKFSKHGG